VDFPDGIWRQMAASSVVLRQLEPALECALRAACGETTEWVFLVQATLLLLKREMRCHEDAGRIWEVYMLNESEHLEVFLLSAFVRSRKTAVLAEAEPDLVHLVQVFNGALDSTDATQILAAAQDMLKRCRKEPLTVAAMREMLPDFC